MRENWLWRVPAWTTNPARQATRRRESGLPLAAAAPAGPKATPAAYQKAWRIRAGGESDPGGVSMDDGDFDESLCSQLVFAWRQRPAGVAPGSYSA